MIDIDAVGLAGIVAMAAVTYATRITGLFVANRLTLSKRAQAAFDAIPAAVLIALIAPMILVTGKAETIAAAITAIAATRLPLIGVVGVGVVSIIALRQL
jgi:uncharacterized membrane protein